MKNTILILYCCLQVLTIYSQKRSVSSVAEMEKVAWLHKSKVQQVSLASANFTVNYYRCEWKIDPDKNYITGIVTPYFILTSPASSVSFDFSYALTIDSILIRGKKLSYTQNADETLKVQLPANYAAGEKDSFSIYYKGTPVGGGFGSFVQSTHAGVPVIWTLSEPYGAKDWWPCRNGLDDKADSMDIYITHPSKYTASSNGVLIDKALNGSSTVTHFKHRYPVASYLVAFAVTNFSVFTDYTQIAGKKLPVICNVYPEDSAYFHSNITSVLNGLSLYSNTFSPYPFLKEKYGQTQFGFGGGMEHQTNSFVISPEENLVTHELAHQWFGDKVTCASWQDIWLNEGFATFCADFLYTEHYNPSQNASNIVNDLNYIVSSPSGSVKVDDTTSVGRIFDSRLSYDKGAFLLRMLRWTLGDSAFFKGISGYLNNPRLRYGFASTKDLKRSLENASGQNLDYFFKQWYEGQGYPSFTLQWSQSTKRKVSIMLSQTTSHNSVAFYKVPLALTFKNATEEKTVVVNFTRNNQSAKIDLGFIADTVLIDKDHQLISSNNKSIHVPAAPVVASVAVSPNPFKTEVRVRLKGMQNEQLLLQLFTSTGQLVKIVSAKPLSNDEIVLLSLPSSLLTGNYILHVSGKMGVIKQTLIKE